MFDKTKIRATIASTLVDCTEVIAVYLFGSVALGNAHQQSDIDIAILFADTLLPSLRFQRALEIGAQLETSFTQPVDVIVLNDAPVFLRFQVLKTGIVLLDFDRTKRCLFHMRAMNRYYDTKPYLDQQRQQTVKRIQEEGLGRGYYGHRNALAEARRLRTTLKTTSASPA